LEKIVSYLILWVWIGDESLGASAHLKRRERKKNVKKMNMNILTTKLG